MTAPYDLSCSIGNYSPLTGDTYEWWVDGHPKSSLSTMSTSIANLDPHSVEVHIHRSGTSDGIAQISGGPSW
jgi:hypothetical protein